MQVFTSYRISDKEKVANLLESTDTTANINFVDHNSSNEKEEVWKTAVKDKILASKKVIFFLSETAVKSAAIAWEFNLTLQESKPFKVVALSKKKKLPDYVLAHSQHIITFSVKELNKFLLSSTELISANDEILLEQYKILIASTEKVTDQRLSTNNLFFTVTSSIWYEQLI